MRSVETVPHADLAIASEATDRLTSHPEPTGQASGRRARATSVPDGRSIRAVSRPLAVRVGGSMWEQRCPAQPQGA